jgi:hypothetical protein
VTLLRSAAGARGLLKEDRKGAVMRKEECVGFMIDVGTVLVREELLTLADLDGMSAKELVDIGLSRDDATKLYDMLGERRQRQQSYNTGQFVAPCKSKDDWAATQGDIMSSGSSQSKGAGRIMAPKKDPGPNDPLAESIRLNSGIAAGAPTRWPSRAPSPQHMPPHLARLAFLTPAVLARAGRTCASRTTRACRILRRCSGRRRRRRRRRNVRIDRGQIGRETAVVAR